MEKINRHRMKLREVNHVQTVVDACFDEDVEALEDAYVKLEKAQSTAQRRQPGQNVLIVWPAGFPVGVDLCPPGFFVHGRNVYFKTADGKIYCYDGRACDGDFGDDFVAPATVEWNKK